MNLPKPVYEIMPVIWILIGIYCLYKTDSIMSYVSGFLLAVTGIVIFKMRNHHRKGSK